MQRSTISSPGTFLRAMPISREPETISSSTTGSGMASRRPGSYRYQPAEVFCPNRPSRRAGRRSPAAASGVLRVAALADEPAHVAAREVRRAEGTHGHAELLQEAVHLPRQWEHVRVTAGVFLSRPAASRGRGLRTSTSNVCSSIWTIAGHGRRLRAPAVGVRPVGHEVANWWFGLQGSFTHLIASCGGRCRSLPVATLATCRCRVSRLLLAAGQVGTMSCVSCPRIRFTSHTV